MLGRDLHIFSDREALYCSSMLLGALGCSSRSFHRAAFEEVHYSVKLGHITLLISHRTRLSTLTGQTKQHQWYTIRIAHVNFFKLLFRFPVLRLSNNPGKPSKLLNGIATSSILMLFGLHQRFQQLFGNIRPHIAVRTWSLTVRAKEHQRNRSIRDR